MSTRAQTTALALALAAATLAAPFPAAALDWTLQAGAEYRQFDATQNGVSTTEPRLDLELALDAAGALGGPGIFEWAGGTQYRRGTTSGDAAHAERDQLAYRLRAVLFSSPTAPLSIQGRAGRVDDQFTTEGTAAGSLLQTTYGGTFTVNAGLVRPWLQGSYDFVDVDQDALAAGRSQRTSQTFGASAGHGSSNFTYNAGYRATLSDGTYALDHFADHRADFDADALLAKGVNFRLSNQYFLRYPTADGAAGTAGPRLELEGFNAVLTDQADARHTQTATYAYTHGVNSSVSSPEVERALHRLSYGVSRDLPSPEWKVRGTLALSLSDDRVGTTSERTVGQALTTTLFWRRTRGDGYFEVRGGPLVGALEPAHGDPEVGYGGTAGVTALRSSTANTQLTYDVTYARNMPGARGWAFSQAAMGSADLRLGVGILRGTLQATGERRESVLLGPGASRSASAQASYLVRRSEVAAQAGLQDGFSAIPSREVTGDGLFIGPAYDSHSWFAALTASTRPWTYVLLRGRLRHTVRDLPDRPALSESEAFAAVELTYGALRLALEETYVISEIPTGTVRLNQVFIKAYRAFGSRF